MPDLVVHATTTYLLSPLLPLDTYFLLLGSILPDLLGRPLWVIFPGNYYLTWASTILHTPLPSFLASYLISLFLPENRRKNYFWSLSVGALGHLLLDMTQKHFSPAYYWLFPFSFRTFEFPLIWADDFVLLIPPLVIVSVIVFFLRRKNSKR